MCWVGGAVMYLRASRVCRIPVERGGVSYRLVLCKARVCTAVGRRGAASELRLGMSFGTSRCTNRRLWGMQRGWVLSATTTIMEQAEWGCEVIENVLYTD